MNKIIKRVVSAVTAVAVTLTAVFVFGVPKLTASAAVGNLATDGYYLDNNGKLTISTDAGMTNWVSKLESQPTLKSSIKTAEIQSGVTKIEEFAFRETALSSIIIANSVKTIKAYAFKDTALSSITIPDGVTTIARFTFLNCSNLTSITLPSGMTRINSSAFEGCRSLSSITIPDNVNIIDSSAFEGCSKLSTVTMTKESKLNYISSDAFKDCISLSSITLPSGVTTANAFNGCTNLSQIIYPSATYVGNIPATATQIKYAKNGSKLKVTEIICGSGVSNVTITNDMNINFVAETERSKVAQTGHTHIYQAGQCTCDICNAENHNYTQNLDDTNHWQECSVCGAKKDSAKHTGGTATCQTQASCSVCNHKYGDKAEHNYSTAWTTDSTQHWHACQTSGCTSKGSLANHTFTQNKDGTNHWQECSICEYKEGVTAHSWGNWTLKTKPALTTTGTAERTCSCGEKQTQNVPNLSDTSVWGTPTHTEPTEEAEGKDVYTSIYGTVTVVLPKKDHVHEWGDWSITEAPTFTNQGTAERVCTKNAAHKETKTLPNLNDTSLWTEQTDRHVDPTVNGTGTDIYHNNTYGDITVTIPKLSDTDVWGTPNRTDPTKTNDGEDTYTSTDYGTVTVTIPKLTDPVWGTPNRTDPTPNGTGKDEYHSDTYGDVTVVIPELSDTDVWGTPNRTDPTPNGTGKDEYHSDTYGDVTVVIPELSNTAIWGTPTRTDPTKTNDGEDKYISTDNGTVTVTIPKLTDPVWGTPTRTDPTKTNDGEDKYTSTDYGTVTVTIPKLTDPVWGTPTRTDPTPNGKGKDEYHSDTYGDVTVVIPELSNTDVWGTPTHTDPTEDAEGKDVYTSEDYGEVEVVLPKKEHTHNWGDWSITANPTLITTGTAERACTKNSTHKETKELPLLTDTTVWTKDNTQHVDPTEDNDGKDVYTSEYGEVTDILPALGHTHNWGNWSITVNPTLTETGAAQRVCTKNSGHTDTKTLPVLTDTSVWTKDDARHVDPTEDNDGKDVYTSEYGEVTDILPALGHTHTWGDWSIAVNPTLTETGTAQRVCTKNSAHTDTKKLPVLTDTSVWTKDDTQHVDPTEDNDGKDVYTSEYGEVIYPLDKLPHTHKFPLTFVPEVKPTEDKEGVKEHWHCDGCEKDFEDEDGTKEVTADDLKIGKIETVVQAPANVPTPEIATPKEELVEATLTEEEQKKVDEGATIKIILKVEDATNTVQSEDKTAVTDKLSELTNYKLGQYLDVTLLKKIGEQQEQKIANTNKPISITFEIPESLRGKSEYSVIRVHGGETAILEDMDSDPNTVTIETDKFSTYALTYREKSTPTKPGEDDSHPSKPSTSDTSDDTSGNTSNDTSDNSSDTTTSNEESSHIPSESSPSEDNRNPSTGIAVSLIPLVTAVAVLTAASKRKRNK